MAQNGTVVTFYSYKGGVGRSFALANIAAILAGWGFRVLCVDWDLDAPGLDEYFKVRPERGLVELVSDFAGGDVRDSRDYITEFHLHTSSGQLLIHLLAAGRPDLDYVKRARKLDWAQLYEEHGLGEFLESCRADWTSRYDFVLIDSRTGITDIGGICTAQLPDILALLFTASNQSLRGVVDVARRAEAARDRQPYERSRLMLLPVPSRFDSREEYQNAEDWQRRFAEELAPLYDGWIAKEVPPEAVLARTTIPYVGFWTFGEELAALREPNPSPTDICYSLQTVAALLTHQLARTDLLAESRDSYVAAGARAGLGRDDERFVFDVAVDFTGADSGNARELIRALRATGLRVWSIEDLGSGDDWISDVQEALARSRHMVVVVGRSGEVGRAVDVFERHSLDEDIERMIFPVVLGPASLNHARLRSRQALFVHGDADLAAAAAQIEQVVRQSAVGGAGDARSALVRARQMLRSMRDWQLDDMRWRLVDVILHYLIDAAEQHDDELLVSALGDLEQSSPTRVASLGLRERRPMPGYVQQSVDRLSSLLPAGSTTGKPITIAVVGEREAMQHSVRTWLAGDTSGAVTVIADGDDVDTVLAGPGRAADVLVLQVDNPVGPTPRRIAEFAATRKVVVCSYQTNHAVVRYMLDAGVSVYLTSLEGSEHFAAAVRAAAGDKPYVTPSMAAVLLSDGGARRLPLTQSERAVLRMWTRMSDLSAVARELDISVETVREHIRRARVRYAACGAPADNNRAMVARAIQDGLIKSEEVR